MFYKYDQNNSGGYFNGPQIIWVEALGYGETDDQAFDRAETIIDIDHSSCPCCGSRWYGSYQSAEEVPLKTFEAFEKDRFNVVVLYKDNRVEYAYDPEAYCAEQEKMTENPLLTYH